MSTPPDRDTAVDRLQSFLQQALNSLDDVRNVETQQPPYKTTTCTGADGGLTTSSTTRLTLQAELGDNAEPLAALARVEELWRQMGLEVRHHPHSALPWISTNFDNYYGEMSIGLKTGRLSLSGSTPCLSDHHRQ